MKNDKKIEIVRKRNIELSQKIQELEKSLEEALSQLSSLENERVLKLINEFDEIIAVLKDKDREYSELIEEMKQMRDFMNTVEFKNFWIKQAKKNFIKNKKND